MGILDFFKKTPAPVNKSSRRGYAAANPGRLFADFDGSNSSADGELKDALGKIRNRSRSLARDNEYARRYLNLLKTNVVGERGLGLQVKALDSNDKLDLLGNQMVESAFKKWGKLGNPTVDGKMSWVDAQKLAIETLARDGELFIVKHRGREFHDTFSLEFLEADQVDETLNAKNKDGNEIRMGVEVDKFRRPVAYHVLGYHPGDFEQSTASYGKKHTRVPADRIIHVFVQLRAGQTRGEPWMAPALLAVKQLGALREASVINARIGASKMGFFTSPAGDGFTSDDLDEQTPIMEAEPGTFHQLPQGVEFSSFDPQYPNNEFGEFHKVVLKGIASGLGVSYTSLSNDLEATSYSSIRQGALEERDAYKNLQVFMVEHFARPIYEAWLGASMEFGTLPLPVRKFDKFAEASEFRGKAWSWVDPLKEMNAAILGMKSGVISIQDVAGQYGKDVEELFAQIQKDKALAEQFGLQYALEPFAAQFVAINPDVNNLADSAAPNV